MLGNGIVFETLSQLKHGPPEAEFSLLEGGIKFDSLQPHLDEIGFGNRAFPKSGKIELNQLLEHLPVLSGHFDVAPREHRLEIEPLHLCNTFAHRVGKSCFGRRDGGSGYLLSQPAFATQFDRFGIGHTIFVQSVE